MQGRGWGGWGLLSARYALPDGTPPPAVESFDRGHGVLANLGNRVQPREGSKLLALSTGTARAPSDPGFVSPTSSLDKQYSSAFPSGFPVASVGCPTTGQPHDGAALEVTLVVPKNAGAFSFDFKFYSSELPGYVCTQYNDQFVAQLLPAPIGSGPGGSISFDAQGNPVSVNAGFLDVCQPGLYGGKFFSCPSGTSELVNTGFDTPSFQGGTTWQTTTAPVVPGSTVTLRFSIWDSGDGILDSTALIDNFRWLSVAALGTTH